MNATPHPLATTEPWSLWATDQDGRPGRTPGQAEGDDPEDAPAGAEQPAEETASQATPDQAEGEEEDA
ncbi:hypothetical protein [Truepera radiovictrix]|uniref:Uncharacterized protein n=1 Tax=Truepera radiovictrix (strain DSM 17093 / CIP 108686 / LMG 22925 / RQ-24) TaxID=649638 RepID=D7CTK4_TRURR|nr:hypothetical protein [Truepera radiovictrix]ADI13861.1 hypothetical protein Trad_0725 [Truepera radiovictrix DSM 17093]WMT57575.1 hypothetical protein RCV51_01200 [Truepera radiovictrix]